MCTEFPDKRLKQERVENAEKNLAMFQHNPKAFSRQSLKMDETGIHHYKFESNGQSAERLESDESRPKIQQSAGKILACIFWNACDIIFIDYLGKWKIVTPKYYAAFLDHLSKVIKNKRSNMAKKKCCFTKTTYRVTHPWKCWQNWMNWSMNFSTTYRILQIWFPVAIICFLTWRGGSRRRDVRQMQMPNAKLMYILEPLRNHTIWNVSKCHRTFGISVSLLKETTLRNKVHFWQNKCFLHC